MRISSTQYQITINTALNDGMYQAARLNRQIASGQRLLVPSDDPLISVRLGRMTREEAGIKQYRDNIANLQTRLSTNETYLTSTTTDMQEARDLLVGAADGSAASADLDAMATPLASLRDSIFASANARDQEGRYVFSGTAAATPAIGYDANQPIGSRYKFNGNTEQQHVVVGAGVTQTANVTVPELEALLNHLDASVASLQAPGASTNDPTTRAIITAALTGTDTASGLITNKVAKLGGAQNFLAMLDSTHANVSLSNNQALIDLGQLDYADAAVTLNGYTLAVQATQKAYAKVSGLSLFDAL